jgi:hypothetical protein
MHFASTRRTFLANSALGALAAGVPLFGQTAQPAATQSTTATQSPTPTPPPAKGAPMPRMAPPYDKATINVIGRPIAGYTPHTDRDHGVDADVDGDCGVEADSRSYAGAA